MDIATSPWRKYGWGVGSLESNFVGSIAANKLGIRFNPFGATGGDIIGWSFFVFIWWIFLQDECLQNTVNHRYRHITIGANMVEALKAWKFQACW